VLLVYVYNDTGCATLKSQPPCILPYPCQETLLALRPLEEVLILMHWTACQITNFSLPLPFSPFEGPAIELENRMRKPFLQRTIFLTVKIPSMLSHINVGYERVSVQSCIPNSMRYFRCHKFWRTQQQCASNLLTPLYELLWSTHIQ
jgi:hypothetical protein